jgi:hypothetical protein
MYFWIAVVALFVGVVISFARGNVKLPLVALVLGILAVIGSLSLPIAWPSLSVLSILAVIIHIANQMDSV